MTARQDHRVVVWVESGVLFLLIAFLGLHTMPRAWATLNTDFPNYYMSARLAHEGFDTAREYEWVWLEREKDHRILDSRVIGLLPITPISTLVIWPLTGLSALAAKHIWILANLALLVPVCWLLRSITGLPWRRIALVFALCFPLHRNLLYGQFYIVLLLLIVAACWAYLRNFSALAGALVAIAAACKVFPVLLFILFLRRENWRALLSGALTGLAAMAVSVAVFGWNLHRTYLHQVLPWTLHGEALPPYATGIASITSVLHYLFLSEAQWNPHPWHNSPLCYALLQPTLQMLVFAPAVLLIRKDDRTPGRILLEWSALITASLAISTSPASYQFVLMVLPVCVLAELLVEREWYGWLAALLIVYVGICIPLPSPSRRMGPEVLLYVPRLPLMLALLLSIYLLLWRDRSVEGSTRDWKNYPRDWKNYPWDWSHHARNWPNYAWAAGMAVVALLGVHSTLYLQRAVRQEFAYRLPLETPSYLDANPDRAGTQLRYVAFTGNGYHLVSTDSHATWVDPSAGDDLSFTANSSQTWVEKALSPHSQIVHSQIVTMQEPARVPRVLRSVVIDDARDPMLSSDGEGLAFIRDDHGRGRLMLRHAFQSNAPTDAALTPATFNVYEASFHSEKQYAFSAVENGRPPQIYLTDTTYSNVPLALGESRYPALSPDGAWLAYSRMEHGVWNLWLRDQRSGATRRIANVPCNQMQPAWENDSRTLLYGTDCGRSLWFTAVARRRVIP
ncbi:MAG TPA: glycosyltransferase 87 family protein [Acidobacteriaceae bacterium]